MQGRGNPDPANNGFNFDNIQRITRNMKPAEVVVNYGTYMGACSAQAKRAVMDLAAELGIGSDRPNLLEIKRYGDRGDVAARPVREKTPSCVKISWSKDNRTARVDLSKLFMIQQIAMQKRTAAHIDVSVVDDVPDFGKALIFHLSSTTVVPREKKKKSDNNSTTTTASAKTETAKTDTATPEQDKK